MTAYLKSSATSVLQTVLPLLLQFTTESAAESWIPQSGAHTQCLAKQHQPPHAKCHHCKQQRQRVVWPSCWHALFAFDETWTANAPTIRDVHSAHDDCTVRRCTFATLEAQRSRQHHASACSESVWPVSLKKKTKMWDRVEVK